MAKRKSYAKCVITIHREIELELDDEKELSQEEEEKLILPILEEKYGKFVGDDEFDVEEIDYDD